MRAKKLSLVLAISAALTAARAQEVIELREIDGSNGFVLSGIDEGDNSRRVSGAGDVNGDGIDDLIIGAVGADPNGNDFAGESYIVFGRSTGFPVNFKLAELDGTNGFVLNGIDANDYSGGSVSGAGDVNGDGIDDIIIGADGADPGLNSRAGASYVVFGRETGFPASIVLSDLDGTNGFVVNGIDESDLAGQSVSGAGDINGDGIDDLIIGAGYASPGGDSYAGEAYVVFGRSIGFSASIELDNLDGLNGFVLNGIDPFDLAGKSVSNAGDVDGDGISDLIVGAEGAYSGSDARVGEAYVVFGRDTGFSAGFDFESLDGTNGFRMSGIDSFDGAGESVSGAGDINGDGINDLIIGAGGGDPDGDFNAGESYVVFGRDTAFPANISLSSLNGTTGFVLNGADDSDRSARSVSGAGDVNGDGIDDLIVGAVFADPDGNSAAGESYVLFGSSTGFPASLDLDSLDGLNGFVLKGIDPLDGSGGVVSDAGDVNGDGIDDFIINASGASPGGNANAGETYVVFGNAAPMAVGDTSLLFDELEDNTSASGSRLDFSVAASYLDVDAFGGIAIIDDQSTVSEGQWQFSRNGVVWSNVSSNTSDASALVLSSESFLRFQPAPNFAGQPGPLRARLWDGRWREPGDDVDITNAVGAFGGFANDDNLLNVTVNITPVNDAPSFAASNPPTVNEDPGGVTVSAWSAFDPGPGEGDQFALVYQVENISNPGLFSVLPTIGTLGNLVYDTRQDASGSSTFAVRVVDSGGMSNGGVNVSGFQTFTITVNPVNDPPNLVAENPPASAEGAGPQTVSNWASIDAGAEDEASQQVTVAVSSLSNPDLFSVTPAVDSAGNLTYTAAPGGTGTSTFTVIASDNGGTANGGADASIPQVFEITVQGDALFSDSFE